MRRAIIGAAAAAMLLTACASTPKTERLAQISLGMNRPEVVDEMGPPAAVRGAITNRYGQTVQVLEYTLSKPRTGRQKNAATTLTVLTFGLAAPTLFASGVEEDYWLYFVDDRLVRWGEAGDWREAADRIYEVRFDTTEQLSE